MICRVYTPGMLAALVGVSILAIRRWQRRGFLIPTHSVGRLPFFDFAALVRARRLHRWFSQSVRPLATERALARFLAQRGLPASAIDHLEVKVDGPRLLVRQQDCFLDSHGQKWWDFDKELVDRDVERSGVVSLVSPGEHPLPLPASTVEQCVEWAADCEEQGLWEQAAAAYRSALVAGGPRADLCFQLAEVLYRLGDVAAARERYYMALELDENFVEARANLGCVLAELGQRQLAIAALQGALQLAPEFADVHYHLARLLDEAGKREQAEFHWHWFLELAPDSPWADIARDRLESTQTG